MGFFSNYNVKLECEESVNKWCITFEKCLPEGYADLEDTKPLDSMYPLNKIKFFLQKSDHDLRDMRDITLVSGQHTLKWSENGCTVINFFRRKDNIIPISKQTSEKLLEL